jgi:hypothetical protein
MGLKIEVKNSLPFFFNYNRGKNFKNFRKFLKFGFPKPFTVFFQL